jgi:hypothetical protein
MNFWNTWNVVAPRKKLSLDKGVPPGTGEYTWNTLIIEQKKERRYDAPLKIK